MLNKIKEFFRKLFKVNNQQYIEAPKKEIQSINETNIQKKSDFKSQMLIVDEQEEKALSLQRNYKEGLIEEENLSEEDFDLLYSLYEKQIEKTKQSIERYKNRIIAVKSKLA